MKEELTHTWILPLLTFGGAGPSDCSACGMERKEGGNRLKCSIDSEHWCT